MCSIFGVFDIKTDAVELRKKALELSRLMRHRGPDWSGIYASDNAIRLTVKFITTRRCALSTAIAISSRPVPTAKLSSRCIRKKAQSFWMICKACLPLPCMTASRTRI